VWGTIWRCYKQAWNTGTPYERDEQMASSVVTCSHLRRLDKPVLLHILNPYYPLHCMHDMAQEYARRNWHLPSRSTTPVTARGRVSYTQDLETWMVVDMARAVNRTERFCIQMRITVRKHIEVWGESPPVVFIQNKIIKITSYIYITSKFSGSWICLTRFCNGSWGGSFFNFL
jgi:hypothetical protein